MEELTPLEKELLRCVESLLSMSKDADAGMAQLERSLRTVNADLARCESLLTSSVEERLRALEEGQRQLLNLLRRLSPG